MAIKKSQLYSTLWESCNALRGSMDASQYKDYVLIILFVKYLSDKSEQPGFRLKVPDDCHFDDFVALKQDDQIGEKIDKKIEKIKEYGNNAKQIGDLETPRFNDPAKFGSGRTKVDTLSRLIAVFENDALDFSRNRAADDDLLGDAYEYLMKNFAAESGKSKGQFYTPAEVSRVMAKVLRLDELTRAEQSIYDPTCGSGSLLLRALAEAGNHRVSLCGQEKDRSTAALAKLNMLLHGVSNEEIKVGDTIGDPQFLKSDMLETFDVCVANPPFSQKNWLASGMEKDPFNRWTATMIPPTKCGDYAFLLHLISSMKAEEGRGACILPHGVLFRGNAEYAIRKDVIKKHYINGIIGLPPNIFFGTGIPAAIIVIDKKDKDNRPGIFFIDAKDGFAKDGAKNRLREQDIKRIVDAWNARKNIDHYCRMVSWKEIEDNDFNLNIPRYIQPVDTEVHQDIESHLHGGLPSVDIDKMETFWKACPTLKDSLFNVASNSRYLLKSPKEDINKVIEEDVSYRQQSVSFFGMLAEWSETVKPMMKNVGKGVRPKDLIADWAENLLCYVKQHGGLVDAYDAYDVLLNYWAETMQDDCYMIANDGWTYPEVKAFKSKGAKESTCLYDEIVCDLLPVDIVLKEYFTRETDEIAQLALQVDAKQSKMDELVDQNRDAFGISEDDEEPEDKTPAVKSADVKNAIKKAKDISISDENLKVLNAWVKLYDEKEKLIKTLKEKRADLTSAVVKKYASLTEGEIKTLVVERKWLATIVDGCRALMQNVTHRISTEISTLAARYEDDLPKLAKDVEKYESEVNAYLAEMGFSPE